MTWWSDQLAGRGVANLPAPSPAPPTRTARTAAIERSDGPWEYWWDYARTCAQLYATGVAPPPVQVLGPVLRPGEHGLLNADAVNYSRLYGGDGSYNEAGMWVVGRPALMAAAFAVNTVVNQRRKAAARRDAEPRWRENQSVAAIATTRRLLCNPGGRWTSFWYGGITEFWPDLDEWSLTLAFDGDCAPLRLNGPAVPVLALWTATAILGSDWRSDYRLAPLLT